METQPRRLIKKKAGPKLHKTNQIIPNRTINFQIKQKLNQEDTLRKNLGRRPSFTGQVQELLINHKLSDETETQPRRLIKKKSRPKAQLHKTAPGIYDKSIDFQTKQKLNKEGPLRKQLGRRPSSQDKSKKSK